MEISDVYTPTFVNVIIHIFLVLPGGGSGEE
jgi:hypothetical protein